MKSAKRILSEVLAELDRIDRDTPKMSPFNRKCLRTQASKLRIVRGGMEDFTPQRTKATS